ncbi:MAG: hypothetical protein K6D37_06835 [Prevotella sp.]|nr:hypothetical protein [Prevotella sp.]
MNIKDKAKEYAEGKAINALTAAIESAYAEGYNAGFNDGVASKEGEKPDDLDDGVEYVDLGLPSGTKWAADYLKDKDGNKLYFPYCEAAKLDIPTKEQYEELLKFVKLVYHPTKSIVSFLGVNGNSVNYHGSDYKEVDFWRSNDDKVLFWLGGEQEGNNRITADFHYKDKMGIMFMGCKLPVILVKQ